jgi:hypothetical protein
MKTAESWKNGDTTDNEAIVISQIRPGECIWVQTRKSNYLFSVVDASGRRGTLTGGSLGDQIKDAVLVGETSEDKTHFDSVELKPGFRALFFLENRDELHRLLTSVITNVTCFDAGSEAKLKV